MDARNHQVLFTRTLKATPNSIVVDPVTNRLFITEAGTFTLSILDGKTGKLLARPEFADRVDAVVVNPQTSRVYALLQCGAVVVLAQAPVSTAAKRRRSAP